MALPRLAIGRPVSVAMASLAVIILGLFAAVRLPIEQFPHMEIPFVGIGIPYDGALPEQVEMEVARPVEEVLSTMSGIDGIRSFSRRGNAWIELTLRHGVDVGAKGVEAKELIESIRGRLPESVRHIFLRQHDVNAQPILNLVVTGPGLMADRLYDILDLQVRLELEQLPGVNSATLFGIDRRYVRVALDPERVAAHRLEYADIQARLASANFFASAGVIDDTGQRWQVRPIGRHESLASIGTLPLNDRGLRLSDVATIDLAPIERTDRRRVNGGQAVGISVFKEPEANLVEVARGVERVLARLRDDPALAGLEFVELSNEAATVLQSLRDVRNSGLLGAALSMLILTIFMRRLLPALVTVAVIPVAACITLMVMYLFGVTINLLSLVGLMLSVGLLVDNSIVVSEAIQLRTRRGEPPRLAAANGAGEVGLAIGAGTLTTIIVFVPSFMSEVQQVAIVQQNIAIPLCTALLASLLFAQTMLPTVLARTPGFRGVEEQGWIRVLQNVYEDVVRLTLHHRGKALIVAALIAVTGHQAYTRLDIELNPEEESSRLVLNLGMRGSNDLDSVERVVMQVEDYLLANRSRFAIRDVFASYSTDWANVTISLDPEREISSKMIQEQILAGLPPLPGVWTSFQARRFGPGSGGGRDRGGWGIRIIGESTAELQRIAEDAIAVMNNMPVIRNARTGDESPRQELQLRLSPERLAQLGLGPQDVARTVHVALVGAQMRRGIHLGGIEHGIQLTLEGGEQVNLDALFDLPLVLDDGETVNLGSVATIDAVPSLRAIRRENRATVTNLQFEVAGIPFAQGQAVAAAVMGQLELPPGYRWEPGAQADEDRAQLRQMVINLIIAVVLIYMVMAALFESMLFPGALLVSIGFSLCGVFLYFWAAGMPLTAMAFTGMLLLMGIVVNNGIVLLDRIGQTRARGVERVEAIVASGRDRLRPILITMATTVAGMLPLALGDARVGGVGPSYGPMARALISGLVFSTFVTLLLLPVLYLLLDDLRIRSAQLVHEVRLRVGRHAP